MRAVEGDRPGQPQALGQHLDVRSGLAGPGDHHLDDAAPVAGRRVDHHRTRRCHGRSDGRQGLVGQPLPDLAGLGVAVQDGVHHLVDRAGADRVVSGVADQGLPGQSRGRSPARHRSGGTGADSGSAIRSSPVLGPGGGLLDVHPVGADPHQQVRPRTRAELAAPFGQVVAGCVPEVVGQRGDAQVEVALYLVGFGHHPAQPGLGAEVVGAVHHQQRVPGPEEGPELLQVRVQAAYQGLGVLGERGPVAVAGHQVLGPHRRTVRCLPAEGRPVDGGGHPPPHHGLVESGLGQDLGHLGDVAEHVGQVADPGHAAEGGAAADAGLQVPDDGLTGHQELVHEDVPRSEGDPPGGAQGAEPVLVLRSDLQVVVDDRQLAVQEEVAVGAVPLHQVEEAVDQADQFEAEGLERLVPFAVPVGVGDDRDAPGRAGPARWRSPLGDRRTPIGRRSLAGGPGRAHEGIGPYSAS